MKRFLLFCAFIILSVAAKAQTTRSNVDNFNTWLMYFGNHKISERIGWHSEIQIRRNELIAKKQQLLLRTGVDYYSNHFRFTLGYAFVETYPYGEFAVANAFPEHRIWEQLLVSHNVGRAKLSHRYRLEQRMLGNATTGEFANGRFENRVRYLAKLTLDITKSDRPLYLAVYDEIFLNIGKEVAYNIFDQNRLYGALGMTLLPDLKLEVGYLYQLVQLRSLDLGVIAKNRIENNHTLQLGLFHTVSFFQKE